LLQIFGFLHASDLLKVARTTKTLRKLLMSRSARAIWIQALRAEPELPECPEGMTEPAWVKLVFESVCHVSQWIITLGHWLTLGIEL
jgi:hypothetical protein